MFYYYPYFFVGCGTSRSNHWGTKFVKLFFLLVNWWDRGWSISCFLGGGGGSRGGRHHWQEALTFATIFFLLVNGNEYTLFVWNSHVIKNQRLFRSLQSPHTQILRCHSLTIRSYDNPNLDIISLPRLTSCVPSVQTIDILYLIFTL